MTLDAPYQETDRINPHFGHWIQPLDEGAWRCVTCGEMEDVEIFGEDDGE